MKWVFGHFHIHLMGENSYTGNPLFFLCEHCVLCGQMLLLVSVMWVRLQPDMYG